MVFQENLISISLLGKMRISDILLIYGLHFIHFLLSLQCFYQWIFDLCFSFSTSALLAFFSFFLCCQYVDLHFFVFINLFCFHFEFDFPDSYSKYLNFPVKSILLFDSKYPINKFFLKCKSITCSFKYLRPANFDLNFQNPFFQLFGFYIISIKQ